MPWQIDVADALFAGATAFGAWAWVVYWGVKVVRKEIAALATSAEATAKALTDHILLTEKRLTMLETEFAFVRRYLSHQPQNEDLR